MDSVLFITDLQQWLAPVDGPLRWLSLHTRGHHYLLIAATLYLSGFAVVGSRIACATLGNILVFSSCRHFFASPRPYWEHPELFKGLYEKGWGMPSGHSQNAVVFWGMAAWSVRQRLFWILALTLMGLIALSRLYLGLHYPDQVIIGLTVGMLLVVLWIKLEAPFIRWLLKQSLPEQLISILLLTSLPILTTLMLHEALGIGSGNNSSMPYQRMIFYTGLLNSTGISLLFAFNHTRITRHKMTFTLIITRTLPGLLMSILLWKTRFIYAQWFADNTVLYSLYWLHGVLISGWVVLLCPLLQQKCLEFLSD